MIQKLKNWQNEHHELTSYLIMGFITACLVLAGWTFTSCVNTALKELNAEQAHFKGKSKLPIPDLKGEYVGTLPNGKKVFRCGVFTELSELYRDVRYNHWIYWTEDGEVTVNTPNMQE